MVALFVGYLLLGQQTNPLGFEAPPEPKSFFAAHFKSASGSNGYEEYLQAADFLKAQDANLLNSVLSNMASYKEPDGSARDLVNRCQQAVMLVHQGNAKPVAYPPVVSYDLESATSFRFTQLARVLAIATVISGKNENSDLAADLAVESLKFSRAIAERSLLHCLVGIRADSFAMSALAPLLPKLNGEQAKRIESWLRKDLARDPALAFAILAESKIESDRTKKLVQGVYTAVRSGKSIRPVFKSVGFADLLGDEGWAMAEDLAKNWKDYTQAQIDDVIVKRSDYIESYSKDAIKLLQKPESLWNLENQSEKNGDATLHYLWPTSNNLLAQSMRSEVKARTQTRILLIDALIIQFRELENRLPDSLEQLAKPNDIKDPLTGGQFRYIKHDDGTWNVYSDGAKDTGPIELVYRKNSVPK